MRRDQAAEVRLVSAGGGAARPGGGVRQLPMTGDLLHLPSPGCSASAPAFAPGVRTGRGPAPPFLSIPPRPRAPFPHPVRHSRIPVPPASRDQDAASPGPGTRRGRVGDLHPSPAPGAPPSARTPVPPTSQGRAAARPSRRRSHLSQPVPAPSSLSAPLSSTGPGSLALAPPPPRNPGVGMPVLTPRQLAPTLQPGHPAPTRAPCQPCNAVV